MKRLLCIVSALNVGGAETFLMKLYRKMDVSRYQMDFIVSTSGQYDEEVCIRGGRIHYIPLRTEEPIQAFSSIFRIVREGNYKYILKMCDTPVGAIDLIAAKAGGAKRVGARSCNALSNEGAFRKVVSRVLRPVMNHIADYRMAPSDLSAAYTFGRKAYQNGAVFLFPNAVDLQVYRFDNASRKQIRAEFGIQDETIVVGHIGRFEKQKNHKYLLEVFKEIAKQKNDSVLLLVGDGSLQGVVKQQANDLGLADRVIFTGVRSDVPHLLSAMDVFLFPSFYEGMPNTVIEAQATGLPCVLSDSITREANIGNLVRYLPLADTPEKWAMTALASINTERMDVKDLFVEKGYDIQSAVKQFVQIVFDDD